MNKFALTISLVIVLAFAGQAWAVPDTPENRQSAAQRYMDASPVERMFDDMIEHLGKSGRLPLEQAAFVNEFTSRMDVDSLKTASLAAMAKHFTADELNALADFYSTREGKSVLNKIGPYMAEVAPVIQKEAVRIMHSIMRDIKDGKIKGAKPLPKKRRSPH
jgi:hypothetical protein